MTYIGTILLRRNSVKEAGDDGEDYVREPQGDGWREGVGMDEHLAELQEEDIGKGKGNTDSDIPADTSATFLG